MRQARGQATLEYVQEFKLATASLPHRVSEEDRVDQCRRSLQPSVIKSLGHLQQFATFAALITAVNHAELLEDDVQYARRAEQQRTSAASSSSGIQPPEQPRGQPSASTQQPGYPRSQWVNASSSNPPRGNKWNNNRNPSTSRPDAGKRPDRQASQPPRGPPRPATRPPNAMDVDNHQWSTSPAGGQPFLAELQDLPDHKLRQKYDIMTGRCMFCHQPGHPIKHCPVLYAHDLRAAEHEHDHALLREAHHWTQHYTAFLRGLASCPKPFIAPFTLWNDDGWVRLEHHVANVNVLDVLEDDDLSDKPYHSSGSGHSSDTDGSYAPRIGNTGYLAAMTVPPPAPTQTLLSPRKRPRSQGPTTQPRGDNDTVPTASASDLPLALSRQPYFISSSAGTPVPLSFVPFRHSSTSPVRSRTTIVLSSDDEINNAVSPRYSGCLRLCEVEALRVAPPLVLKTIASHRNSWAICLKLLFPLVDGKKLAVEALLDSGATHDLKDQNFASEPKGAIIRFKTDDLDYTTGDLKCKAPFYLTTLGH
ncbi:hypothetical protein RI367_007262 [Sorochytrium milnesiophthora]